MLVSVLVAFLVAILVVYRINMLPLDGRQADPTRHCHRAPG